jgi:hypothetical protein
VAWSTVFVTVFVAVSVTVLVTSATVVVTPASRWLPGFAFTGLCTPAMSTPAPGWTALTSCDSMCATFAAVPRTAVSRPASAVG